MREDSRNTFFSTSSIRGPGEDATYLGLLAESQDVGFHVVMLIGPHLAGQPDTRLYLVQDEQELVLIGEASQLLEEFGSEVVVSPLSFGSSR